VRISLRLTENFVGLTTKILDERSVNRTEAKKKRHRPLGQLRQRRLPSLRWTYTKSDPIGSLFEVFFAVVA